MDFQPFLCHLLSPTKVKLTFTKYRKFVLCARDCTYPIQPLWAVHSECSIMLVSLVLSHSFFLLESQKRLFLMVKCCHLPGFPLFTLRSRSFHYNTPHGHLWPTKDNYHRVPQGWGGLPPPWMHSLMLGWRECPPASPRVASRLHIIDPLQRAHSPEPSDFPTQCSKEVLEFQHCSVRPSLCPTFN